MTVPAPNNTIKIKSLGTNTGNYSQSIKKVSLLGYKGKLHWKQEADGLTITCPSKMPYETSVVFKVE
jgi:alpha-L-fucosidase